MVPSCSRFSTQAIGSAAFRFGIAASLALLVGASGCGEGAKPRPAISASEPIQPAMMERIPCADRSESKKALFGDLHVHTAISMDAYLFDTRTRPSDAYRYAKGETIYLAPLDADGQGTHPATIDRPLDFAAVTDHAENFGNVSLCTLRNSPVYDTQSCRTYRGEGTESIPEDFLEIVEYVRRRSLAIDESEVCGEDGRRCRDAADDPWLETQRAAENYYDRSSNCDFTTFVAYEYSLSPELSSRRTIPFTTRSIRSGSTGRLRQAMLMDRASLSRSKTSRRLLRFRIMHVQGFFVLRR